MTVPLVEVVGLRKVFRPSGLLPKSPRPIHALDGVEFRIDPGEFVALVGESGSGKTTLGRCLMGLLRFDAGEVRVVGYDVSRLGRRSRKAFSRDAQMVFQNPYASLDPAFRVAATLVEAVRTHRDLPRAEVTTEVEQLARRVRLPLERLREYPPSLSGGERRRATFARALATRPRFVVTDEPVTGIDPPVQVQLIDVMRLAHARHGTTFLLITHDLRVVRTLATRVLVLYRGRILEDAPGEAFFNGGALHPYSRELLASAFDVSGYLERHAADPGEEPGRCQGVEGCGYHPRCPQAFLEAGGPCATMPPPLSPVAPGHKVACHRERRS